MDKEVDKEVDAAIILTSTQQLDWHRRSSYIDIDATIILMSTQQLFEEAQQVLGDCAMILIDFIKSKQLNWHRSQQLLKNIEAIKLLKRSTQQLLTSTQQYWRQHYANITLILRQYYAGITPTLRQYYASITPMLIGKVLLIELKIPFIGKVL